VGPGRRRARECATPQKVTGTLLPVLNKPQKKRPARDAKKPELTK
jgi:hypothetical protein